jgi:hypothetical protein
MAKAVAVPVLREDNNEAVSNDRPAILTGFAKALELVIHERISHYFKTM